MHGKEEWFGVERGVLKQRRVTWSGVVWETQQVTEAP